MEPTPESHQSRDLLGPLNPVEQKFAPPEFFVAGNSALLSKTPRVSIIGSRDASAAGLRGAQYLARLLVEKGAVVVSGLAKGIDAAAHLATLEARGDTIAVLGTTLSGSYPKENQALQVRIRNEGLLVSEFPEGRPTTRKSFVIRNRTMALISHASIIVEAGEKSGTRHQGWEALRLGRAVLMPAPFVESAPFDWPRKMLDYGAVTFTKESLPALLEELLPFPTHEELSGLSF